MEIVTDPAHPHENGDPVMVAAYYRGIAVAPFALALAAFTAIATCLAHNFWTYKGERFGRELTTALEHLGVIGGLILLSALSAAGL